MIRQIVNKNSKTGISNLQGWDIVIEDAKQRIRELEFSLTVFEQNKKRGAPFSPDWLTDEKAGTADAVPA